MSLPIHQARSQSSAASFVIFDPLDALSILRQLIRCRCCSIFAHIPLPTPLLLSDIPRSRRLSPAASVIVSNPSDASRIPRYLPTTLLLLLSLLSRLTLLTPLLLLSIPSACKHTGASAVRDVHSDAFYFLLPQLMPSLSSLRPWNDRKHTGASAIVDVHSDALYLLLTKFSPPLSSLRPRAHLPLPTPLSWSPITKACHCNAAATVVVPEYPIPWKHCLFHVLGQRLRCCRQFRGTGNEILLTFGLLTSYFF